MQNTTVRQLFLKALSMKGSSPWPEIREKLIQLGHEGGWGQVHQIDHGPASYTLIFGQSGSISFDGTRYQYRMPA